MVLVCIVVIGCEVSGCGGVWCGRGGVGGGWGGGVGHLDQVILLVWPNSGQSSLYCVIKF